MCLSRYFRFARVTAIKYGTAMLKRRGRRKNEANREDLNRGWPHIDITFLDEDDHDETDTFFRSPVVPRVGERLSLDGYFQRQGVFVVERVEYAFFCESRRAGWARDVGVHVDVFVWNVQPMAESPSSTTTRAATRWRARRFKASWMPYSAARYSRPLI